jgi:cystathionine beta-lyase
MEDKQLMEFMVKKAKLGMMDGPRFGSGGENYLRMNIAAPRSLIHTALDQMIAAFQEEFPKKF